ncbi:MAG: hypothetical protein GTN89_14950 [Acidobacteria bacterium]|nr:hypothetical protein [Acidobacteriota bacterium]NIO60506.1 hypothetical protein [Acidobacteriota bacterium]NIQ31626.1 hypothetical protein [Acidobacteriota bacterium]NIQ87113.1 hypothetical protein [Acidobacteriota bacterium]
MLPLLAPFLCCALAAAAAEPAPAAQFEPDTEAATTGALQGTTWVGGGPTWKVWVKQLDGDERLNFIERMTGLAIDPYANRPDEPPAYHTFLVVIENDGPTGLSFNPQSAWLKTNKNKVLLPQGLADLSFNYRVTGRELPAAYENVQGALFERAISVAPGDTASGLLIYDRVQRKTKRWNLGLRVTLSDGERAAFNAPYRRSDLKKKGPDG